MRMKISNEELKQIIKEELEAVLKEGRFNPLHLINPWAGEMYAAAAGKDSFLATREKRGGSEEPERPLYRDRFNPEEYARKQAQKEAEETEAERLEAERWKEENYPIQIANQLKDIGIIAIPEGSGIKIKGVVGGGPTGQSRSGRRARLYTRINFDLSLEDAFYDVLEQIKEHDPDKMRSLSRKRMSRGEESITIDDPMMEGKKRRIKRKR